VELRIVQNGTIRWLLLRGSAARASDGQPVHVVGTCSDVTERKRIADALSDSQARSRDLAGRLIVVQEEERARIARNLHDNVTQRVAALSIRLGVLQRDLGSAHSEHHEALISLRDSAIQLGEEIRHFSHELHPPILKRVGLAAAIVAHCKQFAADNQLPVRCVCSIVATDISEVAALSLYRVCQQSLHNVAKHANATQVVVTLSSTANAVHLVIRDDGRGFDVSSRTASTGLGLWSADERLRLLRGSLVIESEPGAGTIIRAMVPTGRAS
jgi:signal transduction histidine kinase